MNKIIIFLKFSESYCHANWKTTAKLITYVSEVYLKILRSNYLQFSSYTREVCYSFKSNLLFNSCFFFVFFLFLNKFLRLTDLRTYKYTILRPCYYLQAIMYSLLCYFYDCLRKSTISLDEYQLHFNVFI